MIYVFDTSSFRQIFRSYYRSRFPSFWARFDAATGGTVVSVREVRREIDQFAEEDSLKTWARTNSAIFRTPTDVEMQFVAQIFAVPHFQTLLKEADRLRGNPVADPWLIAHAHAIEGTVVTEEADRPNAARIPNVCDHFKVPSMNLERFMEAEGWEF